MVRLSQPAASWERGSYVTMGGSFYVCQAPNHVRNHGGAIGAVWPVGWEHRLGSLPVLGSSPSLITH